MSAVEYTCGFTGQIRRNHKDHKVRLTLSYCKTNSFSKKTKFDSTRHRLNTLKHPILTLNTQVLKLENKP